MRLGNFVPEELLFKKKEKYSKFIRMKLQVVTQRKLEEAI